jgi:hypothetical protein
LKSSIIIEKGRAAIAHQPSYQEKPVVCTGKNYPHHLNAPASLRHMMNNTRTAPTASRIATDAVATADIINVKNKLAGFKGFDDPVRCKPLKIVMRYGGPTKIAKGINIP